MTSAAPSTTTYTFDDFSYELDSKQVRQYRINDSSTVKRAIITNMEEFLASEGVEYDTRSENLRYTIGALSVIVGASTYLAGLYPFRVPFAIMRPYLMISVVFYNVCAAAMYFLMRWVDTDCFFVSHPKPHHGCGGSAAAATSSTVAKSKKTSSSAATTTFANVSKRPSIGALAEGHRVRLRLKSASAFSPMMELEAELLDPTKKWYQPAKVLSTVSHEFSYGYFFDEDGFIYPPNLKQATYQLFTDLLAKKND